MAHIGTFRGFPPDKYPPGGFPKQGGWELGF